MEEAAAAQGLSERALKEARKQLGVRAFKTATGWQLELPLPPLPLLE